MDKIFSLHEQTHNENFIGHDKVAADILELSRNHFFLYHLTKKLLIKSIMTK